MKDNKKVFMKRRIIALVIILIVLILIILGVWFGIRSYSNREQKMICTLHSDQNKNGYVLDSEYNIKYKKDIVEEVHITETVKSENEEVLARFEKQWKDQYSYNKKTFGGYTYNVVKEEGKVSSDVTIDYTTMNLGKFIRFNAAMQEYTKDEKLTYEGIKKMYEKSGAFCN